MGHTIASMSSHYQRLGNTMKHADGLGALALRLYLGPVFIMAGSKKLSSMPDTIACFGNAEWGLGLPFPELLAWAASLTEFLGGWALILGLAVRWVSIPLMVTMAVAALTVHWPYGWQAVADPSWLGGGSERVEGAMVRLDKAKSLLQEYGNYDWLTEHGSLVILNNGIEFSVTYFVMCLMLLCVGAGRYVSLDYWIGRQLCMTKTK